MSLVRRLGVTEPITGTMLSMVEVFFFFCILTVVYFVACSSLYVAVHNHLSLGDATDQAGDYVSQADTLLAKVRKAHDRIVPLVGTQPATTQATTTQATTTRATTVSDDDRTQMLTDVAKLIDEATKLAKAIVTNRDTSPRRSAALVEKTTTAYQTARNAHILALKTRDAILTAEEPTKPLAEAMPEPSEEQGLGSFFQTDLPFFKLALLTRVPVWFWFIQGGVYLLIVTIYWAPGEQAVNENELRALVLSILLAVIILIVTFHTTVWQFVETFLRILGLRG